MFSAPYVDIIIFAILAVFLIFRLRSVLGRRDGLMKNPMMKPVVRCLRKATQASRS